MGIEAALIGGGLGLLGSSMSSSAARDAANTSAAAQTEAARVAADAQRFRPVGITTRFGTSNFQMSPEGYLQSAGYNISPELMGIQNRLLSQAGGQGLGNTDQALAAQNSLFNLGRQYLAESPQQAAQKWMASQQALLQPSRDVAYGNLKQGLFNSGREGLAVAQGGNLGAANPEAQAYYNSLAQQDAQLAAQAQQQGMNQVNFGAGLFGTGAQVANAGYAPLQTQLGLGQTIENLGQNSLDIGAQLGGRSATAGQSVGNTLLQGGLGAARTMQAANQYSPVGAGLTGLAGNQTLMSGIGNWFSGTPSMTAASSTGGWGTGNYFGNQDLGAYL